MIIRVISLIGAATMAVSASQASAPRPLSFNCDAVPGEVTVMDEGYFTVATSISGNLSALQARQDNNLRPAATVKLASAKDFVALQMTPTRPGSSTFDVFVRNGDAREEERTPMGQVTLNQSMPFRIALQGKDVVVAAAGQTISVRQSFRGPANIGVSCSTGHFMFDNVSVE